MSTNISLEEIQAIIRKRWDDIPKDKFIVLWTGKGGAITYYELFFGRPLTDEEKDKLEDGAYEIKDGFINYKGKY